MDNFYVKSGYWECRHLACKRTHCKLFAGWKPALPVATLFDQLQMRPLTNRAEDSLVYMLPVEAQDIVIGM